LKDKDRGRAEDGFEKAERGLTPVLIAAFYAKIDQLL